MQRGGWRRGAALGLAAAVLAVVVLVAGLLSGCAGGSKAQATAETQAPTQANQAAGTEGSAGSVRAPAGDVILRIRGAVRRQAIPGGFVGLSLEYPAVAAYAGTDPSAVNPVLLQLIRNLNPGQPPVLRIGGDSTDWTWWPVAGMSQPAGVNYTLTPDYVSVLHSLATTLGAKLILGINLEADSTSVAAAEAKALVNGIGPAQVEELELGNEPELYGAFTWGRSGRTGRPHGYDFADYNQDIARIGDPLTMAPLAGPATGAPKWFPYLGQFLSSHPRVALATLHRYPLQLCYVRPSEPNYPTIANLLSTRSSATEANSVIPSVKTAHAHGIPLRIDEMNTISCGVDNGVAQSFASALWALDAVFQMARVGVDGVNIHTYPGATYELFTFIHSHGRWRGTVSPEYYGLLMFAQAAPPDSHLLNVTATNTGPVKAWATRSADGTFRVVAINDGAGPRTVAVRLGKVGGAATLERLEAPRLTSRGGVALGGQSFGGSTTTGLLAGKAHTESVAGGGGQYVFRLPGGSAALLTVPPPTG
ncbi:MAG: glycosyl hydrolase family 79 C-terminal domain-containing protein [Solirubrobacteraceae bacterium]